MKHRQPECNGRANCKAKTHKHDCLSQKITPH